MVGGILPAGQISGAISGLIHVDQFIPAMVADAIDALNHCRASIVRREAETA